MVISVPGIGRKLQFLLLDTVFDGSISIFPSRGIVRFPRGDGGDIDMQWNSFTDLNEVRRVGPRFHGIHRNLFRMEPRYEQFPYSASPKPSTPSSDAQGEKNYSQRRISTSNRAN